MIEIENVAGDDPEALKAVTVNVSALSAAVGVPDIKPVASSNCKPSIAEYDKDEGVETLIV